jgi:putative ABC transport system permease protein
MNIMIVAVKERTREIGVRKAIGATSRTVQWQFFSEGLALTFVSGALGYAIGAALCALVSALPMPARFAGLVVTWQSTAFAILVLTLVGVAASVYPARRAASLTPIEALRYEM